MRHAILSCSLLIGGVFLSAQASGAITADSPNFPPCAPPQYETAPGQLYGTYPTAVPPFTITSAQHRTTDGCGDHGGTPPPVGNGNSVIANFFSQLNIQTNFGPATGVGPTAARLVGTNDPTLFQTEMLSMNISGGTFPAGFMIRESPTRQSLGQTTIVPLGGGMWSIDSFFDVFTDVSFDGGQTWHASLTSGHVTLVPEPASLALVALGFGALYARRNRVCAPRAAT